MPVPCAPSVGSIKLGVGDIDTVGVAVGDIDTGGLVGADPVGLGELLVADAEGDVLVDGADCVGVEDGRPLDVGPAELVAPGVFGALSRVVPRPPPPAGVAGTEAVAARFGWLADALGEGDLPALFVVLAAGVTLLVSRTAMIAMIPQAATPAPASSRPLRLGREPP